MREYKILKKGPFENEKKFELRLNELARKGWKVSTAIGYSRFTVILEKVKDLNLLN